MTTTRRIAFAAAALFALAAAAAADTWYVAKSGLDTNTGAAGKPFATIKRGVEALQPGDTLVVGPGVYREEVFIEKSGTPEQPITLRAEFPGRTELVGSVRLADWTPVNGRPRVFRAPLDRVTYLVYEKDTDTEYTEVASLFAAEDTAASFFYDAAAKALYVHPSDDRGMTHHVVDACVLDYGLASLTTDPGYLHTPRRVGLVIDGFAVRDYNKGGIFIHNADFCAITRCIVHHCRHGIFTYSAYRSRIADCESYSCGDRFNREFGNIGMMGYIQECLLENNRVHDTDHYGIRFYGGFYACTMRGNTAWNCRTGIHVKGQLADLETARKYAQQITGKPEIKPDLDMVFDGNTAMQCRAAGLIPNFSLFERNTGVKAQGGRADKSSRNLLYMPETLAEAKFVDPAWRDLRLQSDSPHRSAGKKQECLGSQPYRGDVFFVSPAGNDDAEGTSVAAPWRTLARALGALKAGQTLYILPGTWTEPVAIRDLADAGTPTILRAHGKGMAVLDAAGKRESGIEIAGCRNLRIEGLRIRGATRQGVSVRDSAALVLNENEIIDNAGDGIRIEGNSPAARVTQNTIAFNAGAGLRADSAAVALEVTGNILRGNAVQIALTAGVPKDIWCDFNNLGGGPAGALAQRTLPSVADWRAATNLDENSVDLDPGFVDAAKRDLRLTAESLCKGRGLNSADIGTGRAVAVADRDIRFVGVRAVAVTSTTADLAWETRGGMTTQIVAYGLQPDKLDTVIVRDLGLFYDTRHLVTLVGLKPSTRYYFKVGYRVLPDCDTPYHSFNYAWPERGLAGEMEYYATLKKQDTFEDGAHEFTTPAKDEINPRVYFVSPRGDDAAAGTDAAPFLSIGRACEAVAPGDRVVVRGGVYCETIRPRRSGLPGAPITFEAARGERVEINGARELVPYGADLQNRRHVVIRGFVFTGQSEYRAEGGGFGQVRIVDAADIRVENCLFDGRMNYVNSVHSYASRDVVIHNNIFVGHHLEMMLHDNVGTFTVTHNSFLGVTINKIYGPRNERMVLRNNLFGENLFPKKKQQYKLSLHANQSVDMDYNCYYVDPANDEARMIDFTPAGTDLATLAALPENEKSTKVRLGIRGSLKDWQEKYGREPHSFMADPKWADPKAVAKARSRARGWPNRFFDYPPLTREELRLAPDSPCVGKGENGSTIGALDYTY